MSEDYFLLFKTADAEKRAWRNLAAKRRAALTPILELTRGRKLKGAGKDKTGKPLSAEQLLQTSGVYGFEKNWQSSVELMKSCDRFFVDLTREPSLSCAEIEELGASANGYRRWTDFVIARKREGSNICPTLLVNPAASDDESTYVADLKAQLSVFMTEFNAIAYRVSIVEDEQFLFDLITLKAEIASFMAAGGEFFVLLDHEFVRPGNGAVHARRTTQIIQSIYQQIGPVDVVVLATSFPKSVTEVGNEDHDRFRVEEMYLFDEVKKTHRNVKYGDYGSINPTRNDEVIIANGWRPRIDFVSRHGGLSTYYFRERRKVVGTETVVVQGETKTKNVLAPYSIHYRSVANSVIGFVPYYERLTSSWGHGEILSAAAGKVPSNSPSYWISVRMEIHIVQILKHFNIDPT